MDYGDEFNDDEEERYAKENFGGKSSQNESEDGEEESNSYAADVVPLAKDFSKRENRGQRMTALVGKAQDEDDDFWAGVGNDFFGGGVEASEDDDFNSEAAS